MSNKPTATSSECVCRAIQRGCHATEHDYDAIPDPVPDDPEVAALRAELATRVQQAIDFGEQASRAEAERDELRAAYESLAETQDEQVRELDELRAELAKCKDVLLRTVDQSYARSVTIDELRAAYESLAETQDEQVRELDELRAALTDLVDALRWHNEDTYNRELPDWRDYREHAPTVSPIDGHKYLRAALTNEGTPE